MLFSFLAVGPLFRHPSRRSGDLRLLCLIVDNPLSSTDLLASCHQDHPSVRVHPVQSADLSCAHSPASLLASASISPRERRTHTVFAVWCLGSSRACGGSTSCSPVHVLTHVFSSVRFLHVLCVVWWYPELGSSRHSLGFRRAACCVAVLCVAGNTSLLEPLPRRSALCTFRRALLCSISRDRAMGCSGSSRSRRHPSQVISLTTDAIVVWLSPLRPPGCSPAEVLCDSPHLSPLRLAMCLVVSGHFSTGTSRRRHARIDRPVYMSGGACYCWSLVLLPCLCCTRSKHVQRRVRSLLAIVPHREALWKVFCYRAAHSELLLPAPG